MTSGWFFILFIMSSNGIVAREEHGPFEAHFECIEKLREVLKRPMTASEGCHEQEAF